MPGVTEWSIDAMEGSQSRGNDRHVLLCLSLYANHEGIAYPGLDVLCRLANLSAPTVIASLRALERAGDIQVAAKGGSRRATEYRLMHGQPRSTQPAKTQSLPERPAATTTTAAAIDPDFLAQPEPRASQPAQSVPEQPDPWICGDDCLKLTPRMLKSDRAHTYALALAQCDTERGASFVISMLQELPAGRAAHIRDGTASGQRYAPESAPCPWLSEPSSEPEPDGPERPWTPPPTGPAPQPRPLPYRRRSGPLDDLDSFE